MNDIKLRMRKDGPFVINDKLAGLVPMATEPEQIALNQDLLENEQREPIVLWKGEIVDGRCRQAALILAGKNIAYKELDDELTEDEVAVYVKSVNTRRNLTVTQKAMTASKSKLNKVDNRSNPVIAKSWGVSEGLIKYALYIWRENEKMAIELFNGRTVEILNDKGKPSSSSKITAVYAHLRRLKEVVSDEDKNYTWSATEYIKTQVGIDWYFEYIASAKSRNEILSETTRQHLGELANYKFTKDMEK